VTRHESSTAARDRFFGAAVRVCATRGFAATRMADIAAEAGRSKGAIYHHFPTKHVLFVELVHNIVDKFTGTLDAGMLQGVPARALIERSMVGLLESFGGVEIFRVFSELLPLAARDPELQVPLTRYYAQSTKAFAALLRWGQQRGELRPDFSPDNVARMLSRSGDGIFILGAALGELDSAADDVRELFARVFDGLEPHDR